MKETKTNPSSKFMSLGAKTYVLLTQNLHFRTGNRKFYVKEKLKNESVTKIRIRHRKQEYDFQKTMKRKGFVDTQNQLCIIRIWKI